MSFPLGALYHKTKAILQQVNLFPYILLVMQNSLSWHSQFSEKKIQKAPYISHLWWARYVILLWFQSVKTFQYPYVSRNFLNIMILGSILFGSSHFSDIIWALLHLRIAASLPFPMNIHASNKESTKALNCWPFLLGIRPPYTQRGSYKESICISSHHHVYLE